MLTDIACRPPLHPPPSFYIFKTPNGVRVPAAHFFADIRGWHPHPELSSQPRHGSSRPFFCGHPWLASWAGTFQPTTPLFQPPIFLRTSVAGILVRSNASFHSANIRGGHPPRSIPARHVVLITSSLGGFLIACTKVFAHPCTRAGQQWDSTDIVY